jgi:hypothetical protein
MPDLTISFRIVEPVVYGGLKVVTGALSRINACLQHLAAPCKYLQELDRECIIEAACKGFELVDHVLVGR